jgi:multidrug efflux system outer membrane protein
MNRPFMIVWVGIGLLLGACSMTPPYTRPEAPVAQTWPGGPAYEKSGTQRPVHPGPPISPGGNFSSTPACSRRSQRPWKITATFDWRPSTSSGHVAIYGIQRSALYPAVDATASGSKQRVAGGHHL